MTILHGVTGSVYWGNAIDPVEPGIHIEAGLSYPGSCAPATPALVAHVQGGLTLGPEWGELGAEKYNHGYSSMTSRRHHMVSKLSTATWNLSRQKHRCLARFASRRFTPPSFTQTPEIVAAQRSPSLRADYLMRVEDPFAEQLVFAG
jgi:hypothetical protein